MEGHRPSIGRIVQYTNLGDKDGKYPPEVQAAVVTGVYANNPKQEGCPAEMGSNDPQRLGLVSANALGATVDAYEVDLKVFYRTGLFDTKCVPYSAEPKRGHWNWPPRV